MKPQIQAESLIGIIIWIFILSFVLIGIGNVIFHSKDMIIHYDNMYKIDVLKYNMDTILRSLNTSDIAQNEIFYIYKNIATKRFEILTGSVNEEYKYIDENGNKVDRNNFEDDIYERTLQKQIDDSSLGFRNQVITVHIHKLERE